MPGKIVGLKFKMPGRGSCDLQEIMGKDTWLYLHPLNIIPLIINNRNLVI